MHKHKHTRTGCGPSEAWSGAAFLSFHEHVISLDVQKQNRLVLHKDYKLKKVFSWWTMYCVCNHSEQKIS